MKNKRGFTLIELLAVIVILGILLGIAIPSVAKYINTARKSTYVENVQSYARAAKNEALTNNKYQLPTNTNDATVITFELLKGALENGGINSPYGGTYDEKYSYVMIVNDGTAEEPHYTYYIAALDTKGYGIGGENAAKTGNEAKAIAYDLIKEVNVVQLSINGLIPGKASENLGFDIKNLYSSDTTMVNGVLID